MKKIIPGLLTLLLTSCTIDLGISFPAISSSDSSNDEVSQDSLSSDQETSSTSSETISSNTSFVSSEEVSSIVSSSSSSEEAVNYRKVNRGDLKYTLRDTNENIGWSTSVSTGDQKFLIVPIQITGQRAWTQAMLTDLENIFFGEASSTQFESVSSYFEKSSYGNLSIDGEVLEPFLYNQSKTVVESYGDNAPEYIIEKWYENCDTALIKNYDVDRDGYIDNAVFVYSNEYEYSENSPFWAWCTYSNYDPNVSSPTVNNYMWVSYTFSQDSYRDGFRNSFPSTHTYIHEAGHLLGLDDYYSYDGTWDCAGTLEMQSFNVGDHNIYSKLALGWVDPYYVIGETQIRLKTSALYGETIIINDSWNGTPFDEYIIIEYYTPQGLNEQDSKHRYDTRDLMYNYNGLRIYHVDARLIKMNSRGKFISYVEEIDYNDRSNYYYVGASNTPEYSYLNSPFNSKYRYVHLLDQGEQNRINNGNGTSATLSSSTTLWTGSKTFTPSTKFFANGEKFNDGTAIGYSVSVSELTDEDCLVTISKI